MQLGWVAKNITAKLHFSKKCPEPFNICREKTALPLTLLERVYTGREASCFFLPKEKVRVDNAGI